MSHSCHLPECNVPVPRKMFMCRAHWFMIPKPLRDAVWAEYRPGQERGAAPVTDAYISVTRAAIKAVEDRLRREEFRA